jgi:hypothetical protein
MITAAELLGQVIYQPRGRVVPAMSQHDRDDEFETEPGVVKALQVLARKKAAARAEFEDQLEAWQTVGRLIDDRRAAMGLYKRDAAKLIGVCEDSLARYVRAAAPIPRDKWAAIQEHLGVDVAGWIR